MNTITIGGQDYKVGRFDSHVLDSFVEWANTYLPDPVKEAVKLVEGFPPALQTQILNDALATRRRRKSVESDEIKALLSSVPGVLKILCLAFQRYNPGLSEQQVEALLQQGEDEHGLQHMRSLFEVK